MRAHVHACNLAFQSKGNRVHHNLFSNEAGESLSFVKKAQYIGSFLVTASSHFDRADIVRQKLEAARDYTRSKPILLAISLHGIKICDDSGTNVYMTHALRRISYATCDPDFSQFAFLAREPKALPNVQYCHAFVTDTPAEAEKLNHLVGEAFRIAYVQQRVLLESRRSFTQTQPSNLPAETSIVGDSSQQSHRARHPTPSPPPRIASIPVPEADSGIATTDAAFFRQKIDAIGYLAADPSLKNLRTNITHPQNGNETRACPKFSTIIDSSACGNPASLVASGLEDNEDVEFVQQPTSASHLTPVPVTPSSRPRTARVADKVELSDSLAALLSSVGQHKFTPFSPSACLMNAYDQAFESMHCPSDPVSRQRQPTTNASFATCSNGRGGDKGGADCLETSSGGIGAAHGVGSPISAPWYQPHIPRELALDMLSRQPPGSFVVRDSGTHLNCYALSVRVDGGRGKEVHSDSSDVKRCLSADTTPRTSTVRGVSSADGGGGSGVISHYLIQRTATGVRLKGLDKEWPSLVCLILHLTVIPEMLPCPLLDAPQSASNPSAFLHGGDASTHPSAFEQAPDACVFRPISVSGRDPNILTSPPRPVSLNNYQQLSEFSSLLADLNLPGESRRNRRHPPPPPPARIR